MGIILTKPTQTLSGIPGTILTGKAIPSTITEVIDSVSAVYNYGVKWIVTTIDDIDQNIQQYEVNVIKKFDNTTPYNIGPINGDVINHIVNVDLLGDDITLLITNNESHNILVNVIRIQTLI